MQVDQNKTVEELLEENEILKSQNVEFEKIVKDINKKIISKFWLLWLIPIVGWVVFVAITSKRRLQPEFNDALVKVKTEIATNEFKIMLNNARIEKIK
ncbi:hypothetical protein [Mesoplasma photuris]|uniref:hypothetical protein n=1 Tax=Mesoplasma photuris TaxID=217731 RepID=UPI0004E0D365|nr:hypothetical protein [Mesoplasma photuris]